MTCTIDLFSFNVAESLDALLQYTYIIIEYIKYRMYYLIIEELSRSEKIC